MSSREVPEHSPKGRPEGCQRAPKEPSREPAEGRSEDAPTGPRKPLRNARGRAPGKTIGREACRCALWRVAITCTDARSASDPALYRAIAERAGPWMRPDLDEAATGEAFHERAVATLLDRIARKERFALEALEALRARDGDRPELMTVVFSESDTVGHHYWRDHDPASPRHDPGASEARKGAVAAVYERLDLACGRLRAAYGQDALCCVVSDHGMGGAGRHVVHLNRFLEEQGFLHRLRGAPLDAAARRTRDAALRLLPPRLAQRIFRRLRGSAARLESAARFGGIDFAHTTAFSEEANTQPGVWITRRGREAFATRGILRGSFLHADGHFLTVGEPGDIQNPPDVLKAYLGHA